MKFVIALLALILTLTLTIETLAEAGKKANGKEEAHRDNTALFPQPQPNSALATPPAQPELVEPAFKTKFKAASVLLKWNASEGADAYHLQVATDPNFKWLVAEQNLYTNTSYDLNGLEAGKHYYWRVAALKTNNKSGHMKSAFKASMFAAE